MSVSRTRFYLDKRNGKVMGVMAGLADYTGVDVTLMRVGFVLLTVFATGGIGFLAYLIVGLVADDKPREFYEADRQETKFWQGVRAKPGNSIRNVHSTFRDIDRRLVDVETHFTNQNSRLAAEIESLR